MGVWFVRPVAEGGWQVLPPCRTQAAAVLDTQKEAIEAASTMIGDEGGGELIVLTTEGEASQTYRISPSAMPYQRAVPRRLADEGSA